MNVETEARIFSLASRWEGATRGVSDVTALLWTGIDPALTLWPVKPSDQEKRQWQEEFEAAARRPLAQRMRYAFVRTHKPVLDDEPYRAFDTMEEYRQWCEQYLPSWLGYGRSL